MTEYIEKEKVKAEFRKNFAYGQNENFAKWLERVACEIVDKIPVADVQPVDRWICVINELPKTTKSCLVWYEYDSLWGRFRDYGISWYTGESWYKGFLEGDNIEVLYWQPLPKPPEAIKG